MVEESMILAGEAAAGYAAQRGIPLPFSNQDPPDGRVPFDTLSGMFAMRRFLRRSQYRAQMGPHSGLGLPGYVQATSPLRRYLDLVAHQQLRAGLRGGALLNEGDLLERIGSVEAALPALRQAELRSEKHWTLVHLLQHPRERWEGVLVDKRGASGTVMIPALALEARVHLPGSPALDALLALESSGVNLPDLEAFFNVTPR
jgi:exoribonuclease-2